MAQTTFDQRHWPDDDHATFDLSGLPRSAPIPLLTVVYGIGLALYLGVEPTQPWILLALVGLVGLGADGILRSHPEAGLRGIADTAPFLFIPVLFALASGLFLEETISGYEAVPAAIVSSLLFAGALYGEYTSVSHGPSYAFGRLALHVLTYVAAFGFYAVVFEFDVELLPAAFAIGLFSMLLAVELFREAEADAYRALVFAGAIGLVVAELRWALYFIPLEEFLSAIVLLLGFYLATGLVQHHLTNDLDRRIALEFGVVTAAGVAIIVIGRALSLG